jgi:hypothetical protein
MTSEDVTLLHSQKSICECCEQRPQGCVQSDIDVLVEFNKLEKSFDNYMELKFYLEKLFHRRVDLVIREALKPRIRQHILKEVIYARL